MAPPKIQTIALSEITYVYAGGDWVEVKAGSFKEETEGYAFENASGDKYFCTANGVVVTNHVQR